MDEQRKRKYQLRELCKELLLLEGHLGNYSRAEDGVICCDCGKKHAMALAALAKESLGILPELASTLQELVAWADAGFSTFEVCQLDTELTARLVGEARRFRLVCMRALEGMAAPTPAQPVSSGTAVGAASSPLLHAHGYNPCLLDGEDGLLLHAIPDALGMGGIVIDAERAKRHPCLRFAADGGHIVFAKGIVGALTAAEQTEFCGQGFIEGSAAGAEHIHRRVERFKAGSTKCHSLAAGIADPAARVRAYVECMGLELRATPPPPEPPAHVPSLAEAVSPSPAEGRKPRARRRAVQSQA